MKRRNLLPRYKQSSGVLEDKNVSTGSALDPMYPVVSKQTYRAPPTSPNANVIFFPIYLPCFAPFLFFCVKFFNFSVKKLFVCYGPRQKYWTVRQVVGGARI